MQTSKLVSHSNTQDFLRLLNTQHDIQGEGREQGLQNQAPHNETRRQMGIGRPPRKRLYLEGQGGEDQEEEQPRQLSSDLLRWTTPQ